MPVDAAQAERLHKFAHDLRNRLIGLQQVIERLREGPPAEEREEFAMFGDQQFFKALREVETLMDDLGVVRDPVIPSTTRIALHELVREQVDLMNYRFERKQQTIDLELEIVQVMADERMLRDLVDALLSNASKFAEPGTSIAVRCTTDGPNALFDVTDTGTGLSSADLQHVFHRFAWLANRPTGGESQGRGTLARARHWAIAHKGDLFAESAGVGKGCRFTLRLPSVP